MENSLGNCLYCSSLSEEFNGVHYYLNNMIFEMKSSKLGDIIYKCIGLRNNLEKSIIDYYCNLIKEEFENLTNHSIKRPNYFIKCYEILENELYLDSKVHEKLKEAGYYRLYGFTMERMTCDLNKMLLDFKNSRKKFSDMQLFVYLKDCVEIMCYMQENEFSHRDIKLDNIFIDKTNRIRLGDLGSSKKINYINKKLNSQIREYNYQIENLHSVVGTKSYMAPEIFFAHLNKEQQAFYNPYKADLFSLGRTFLNLATLNKRDITNSYNLPPFEQTKFLNKILSEIEFPKLKKCLELMLRFDPNNRPDFLEFRDIYFNKIYNEELKSFQEANKDEDDDVTVHANKIILNIKEANPNDINKEMYQIKTYIKDIYVEKTLNNYQYRDIRPDEITLDEGSNMSIFRNKGNKGSTFLIKSNNFYSSYSGLYNNNRVIITKFSFVSYSEIKTRFLYELNFILNSVNTESFPLLVNYYGIVSDSEYIYLISEYIETPMELKKSIKIKKDVKEDNTKFYSLDFILKNFTNSEEFNSFFDKRREGDKSVEETNYYIRLKILKQLLLAFKYLKDKGVCFLDLNTKKILIEKDKFDIKLRHYGLSQACFKHRYSSCSKLFAEDNGFIFWPPEFFDGYIDEKMSDLWALGVCIFQIFSNGKNPWEVNKLGHYLIEAVFKGNSEMNIVLGGKNRRFIEEIIAGLLTRIENRKSLDWVFEKLND